MNKIFDPKKVRPENGYFKKKEFLKIPKEKLMCMHQAPVLPNDQRPLKVWEVHYQATAIGAASFPVPYAITEHIEYEGRGSAVKYEQLWKERVV